MGKNRFNFTIQFITQVVQVPSLLSLWIVVVFCMKNCSLVEYTIIANRRLNQWVIEYTSLQNFVAYWNHFSYPVSLFAVAGVWYRPAKYIQVPMRVFCFVYGLIYFTAVCSQCIVWLYLLMPRVLWPLRPAGFVTQQLTLVMGIGNALGAWGLLIWGCG